MSITKENQMTYPDTQSAAADMAGDEGMIDRPLTATEVRRRSDEMNRKLNAAATRIFLGPLINKLETMMLDQTLPLDYPSILKQRIEHGELTLNQAIYWLCRHGVTITKARELLGA